MRFPNWESVSMLEMMTFARGKEPSAAVPYGLLPKIAGWGVEDQEEDGVIFEDGSAIAVVASYNMHYSSYDDGGGDADASINSTRFYICRKLPERAQS